MKKLWEYKLDLIYYGIKLSPQSYNELKKNKDGNVNNDDYITTKGLFIILDNQVYVSSIINTTSIYSIDYKDDEFFLKEDNNKICSVNIIQPPDFALESSTLPNGELITNLINIHGDRIRIQPIEGCANICRFCSLNRKKYKLNSIQDLDDAFTYAMNKVGFRHVLISGGSPVNNQNDFDYLNNIYRFFGEKYGKTYPIDIMLVPRGLFINDNSDEAYEQFLKELKGWNISGLYINLELYNDFYRQKYIPQKDAIGKGSYFKFIKLAIKIFGRGNVKSCIIIGLEDIKDSIQAVHKLCAIGCIPVLSPYIPNDKDTFLPTPDVMKDVLLKTKEITDKFGVELGPTCNYCKHNTIHFK